MIEFTDGEWFQITGRGNVFATKMPVKTDSSLLNTEVLIQGHQYTVTGVERFMNLMRGPELTKGTPVGLLVRGPRKDV